MDAITAKNMSEGYEGLYKGNRKVEKIITAIKALAELGEFSITIKGDNEMAGVFKDMGYHVSVEGYSHVISWCWA